MTSPSNPKKGAFATRPALARMVAVKRLFARLVLVSEQLLPLLLLPASILALFLSAAWFGIFRITPDIPRFLDRKSTRLNSSHLRRSRMPSSA